MKREKLKKVEQDFVDGEIGEDELEENLDTLMESGDEFLHEDEDEQLVSNDARFKAREVSEVVAYIAGVVALITVIAITKGAVIPLLIPVALFILFYKVGIIS